MRLTVKDISPKFQSRFSLLISEATLQKDDKYGAVGGIPRSPLRRAGRVYISRGGNQLTLEIHSTSREGRLTPSDAHSFYTATTVWRVIQLLRG